MNKNHNKSFDVQTAMGRGKVQALIDQLLQLPVLLREVELSGLCGVILDPKREKCSERSPRKHM